jgi:hypothetical protein
MTTTPTVLFCEELPRHKGGTYYANFFPHPGLVKMCRGPNDARPILEAEVSEGTDTPDTYWGWWEKDKGEFLFVYTRKLLVEICFPYGVEPEEARGRGKLLPVNIKILRTVDYK